MSDPAAREEHVAIATKQGPAAERYEPTLWVEASWSSLDASGSPSSGSVRHENVNTDGAKVSGIGQCIPVVAGESYRVGTSIYVPSGQAATGLAGILFQWMASADCTGDPIGGGLGTTGEWAGFDEWLDWVSDLREAPPGAHAMMLDLRCRKTTASGTFVAYWDDVFVVPEPRPAAALLGVALGFGAATRVRRVPPRSPLNPRARSPGA